MIQLQCPKCFCVQINGIGVAWPKAEAEALAVKYDGVVSRDLVCDNVKCDHEFTALLVGEITRAMEAKGWSWEERSYPVDKPEYIDRRTDPAWVCVDGEYVKP